MRWRVCCCHGDDGGEVMYMCGCGYGFSQVQIHPLPLEYGLGGVNGCVVKRGGWET